MQTGSGIRQARYTCPPGCDCRRFPGGRPGPADASLCCTLSSRALENGDSSHTKSTPTSKKYDYNWDKVLVVPYRLDVQRVLARTASEQVGFRRLLITTAAGVSIHELALDSAHEI